MSFKVWRWRETTQGSRGQSEKSSNKITSLWTKDVPANSTLSKSRYHMRSPFRPFVTSNSGADSNSLTLFWAASRAPWAVTAGVIPKTQKAMLRLSAAPGSTGASFSCYSISAELPLVSSNSVKALASLFTLNLKKKKHTFLQPPRCKSNQGTKCNLSCNSSIVLFRSSLGWLTLQQVLFSQFSTNDTTTNMLQRFLISERSVSGDHIRTFARSCLLLSRKPSKAQGRYAAWYAWYFSAKLHQCTISTHESILESEVRQNPSHHHLASLRCCWVSLSSLASEISPGQATESESISTSKRSTNSRSMHNPTTVNKSLHPTGLWHMMIWCMMS